MRTPSFFVLAVSITVGGCATSSTHPETPVARASSRAVRSIDLPGAPDSGVALDYLAVDRARARVWVPAGGTGRVDVIEAQTGKLSEVSGFPTAEFERNGHRRVVGPSSASVGDGLVYVGNRGDSSVCAIDAQTLAKGPCAKLEAMPDGVAFVASRHEVWVTTPRNKSIVVLDASTPSSLSAKETIRLDGEPEGYAVDDLRGLFFTNLEDLDRTLAIDLATHAVVHTWTSGCGEGGPKGLAFDAAADLLFLACPDRVKALSPSRDGAVLSQIEVGQGLDNLDFLPGRREIFAAAGRTGQLTIARVSLDGVLTLEANVPTAPGARNAVATSDGTAFVADGPHGRLLVVSP